MKTVIADSNPQQILVQGQAYLCWPEQSPDGKILKIHQIISFLVPPLIELFLLL